ncbi:MAG: hypothetical protein U9O85_04025 [Euryarchaeota archaeon]|nr:hypothetical protein [Euryarchaeota archaeon]
MKEEKKKKRTVRRINNKKAELSKLATFLFDPVGKNPYYLNRGNGSIAIKNFAELRGNLDAFTEEEAPWLAMWIEYLGDKETAARIRETPGEFKEIIIERHGELQEFFSGRK